MSLLDVPAYDLYNESDVEQKFLFPLLTHPHFLDIPPKAILTKRSLVGLSFVDKSTLPKGYIPDYIIFLGGMPVCVIEAKSPDVQAELALSEARLYCHVLNAQFPSGLNPVLIACGCNGRDLLVGSADTSDYTGFSVDELMISSQRLATLRNIMGAKRLDQHAKRLPRVHYTTPLSRPAQYIDAQAFRDRVTPNSLAPYLTPLYEMFFRAEDPEKIQLIIERAYVDTAELRQYDQVINSILRQVERRTNGSLYQPVQTDRKREYTITPELSRYQHDIIAHGRMHLIIGARGSGKTLFVSRFFSHLMPNELRESAVWCVIDFNRAPSDLGNVEDFICEKFTENVQNVGFDPFTHEGLNRIFSVELNRLQKGALAVLSDQNERERLLAAELVRMSVDGRNVALKLARHITGEQGRPVIVAFDNVDRRTSDQQLMIFQAAQWFRNETRSFALLTLRDLTFERYKGEPPLDAFAQISNFYIRPPRFSLVLQKRLELAISEGLKDIAEIEQQSSTGIRFRYGKDQLGVFLQKVYDAIFGGDQQVGHIVDALAERDVREALGMFSRILASGHFNADHVIGIGTGGTSRITNDLLIKILMRSDYRLYSSNTGFIHNLFWTPRGATTGNIFLTPEVLGFFAQSGGAGSDRYQGYWRLQELIADMGGMGFEEAETIESTQNLLRRKMLAFDGEDLEVPRDDDLLKITASGYIHLRSLPFFIEYLSSMAVHCSYVHHSIARSIGETWASVGLRGDLPFEQKHKVASLFADYIVGEKARIDANSPLFRERSREAENLVKVITQSVNVTQAAASRRRSRSPTHKHASRFWLRRV